MHVRTYISCVYVKVVCTNVCGCVGLGWIVLDGEGCLMDGWTCLLVCKVGISAHFGARE